VIPALAIVGATLVLAIVTGWGMGARYEAARHRAALVRADRALLAAERHASRLAGVYRSESLEVPDGLACALAGLARARETLAAEARHG